MQIKCNIWTKSRQKYSRKILWYKDSTTKLTWSEKLVTNTEIVSERMTLIVFKIMFMAGLLLSLLHSCICLIQSFLRLQNMIILYHAVNWRYTIYRMVLIISLCYIRKTKIWFQKILSSYSYCIQYFSHSS